RDGFVGHEAGGALGVRHRRWGSEEWRGRLRTAARAGAGRVGKSGDEFVEDLGLRDALVDDRLLHRLEAGTRPQRSLAASATQNAQEQRASASVLLGEFYTVR